MLSLGCFVKVSSKWKIIHEISLGRKSAENLELRRISLSVSEKYILYGAYKLFICLRQFLSRLSQITIGSKLINFLTSVLVHRKFTLLMGKNWRMPRLFEEFGLYNQLQGYYFVAFLFFSNIGLKILKLWYFLWASQWVLSLYLICKVERRFSAIDWCNTGL